MCYIQAQDFGSLNCRAASSKHKEEENWPARGGWCRLSSPPNPMDPCCRRGRNDGSGNRGCPIITLRQGGSSSGEAARLPHSFFLRGYPPITPIAQIQSLSQLNLNVNLNGFFSRQQAVIGSQVKKETSTKRH